MKKDELINDEQREGVSPMANSLKKSKIQNADESQTTAPITNFSEFKTDMKEMQANIS